MKWNLAAHWDCRPLIFLAFFSLTFSPVCFIRNVRYGVMLSIILLIHTKFPKKAIDTVTGINSSRQPVFFWSLSIWLYSGHQTKFLFVFIMALFTCGLQLNDLLRCTPRYVASCIILICLLFRYRFIKCFLLSNKQNPFLFFDSQFEAGFRYPVRDDAWGLVGEQFCLYRFFGLNSKGYVISRRHRFHSTREFLKVENVIVRCVTK